MQLKNPAGIIFLHGISYLDHLAPLCSSLDIPLIVCDVYVESKAIKYYPNLKVIYQDYFAAISYTIQHFDSLISCLPYDFMNVQYYLTEKKMNKTLHKVWCPHGNSDKGHILQIMEKLENETFILTYGQKMMDFIKNKVGEKSSMNFYQLENYRYQHYLKNQKFYEKLFASRLPQNAHTNLLYCPTWEDFENSSSFFDTIPTLLKHLPKDMNLLVKAHPNIELYQAGDLECIIQSNQNPHVHFIHDIPTIYPLLKHVDVYLGDLSSVNYDCLTFDIPMYFMKHHDRNPITDKGLYSYQFGTIIELSEIPNMYTMIQSYQKDKSLKKIRKSAYEYTFGKINIPSYKDLFHSSKLSDVPAGSTNTVCKS